MRDCFLCSFVATFRNDVGEVTAKKNPRTYHHAHGGIVKIESDAMKLPFMRSLNSPSPHYSVGSIAGDHPRKKLRRVLIWISFSCDPEKSTVFDVNLLKSSNASLHQC